MLKVLKSICRKLWCLSACKKSTSSLFCFFSDIIKTLQICSFGNFWNALPSLSNLRKLSCLSACKKLTSLLTSFLKILLERNSKLVILGNLSIPGHQQLKWLYQFKETIDVYYLCTKINFIFHNFLKDIAKT